MKTTIENLPNEILSTIAELLDLKSLNKLILVNKRLFEATIFVRNKKKEQYLTFLANHIIGMINFAEGSLSLPPLLILLQEFPPNTMMFNKKTKLLVLTEFKGGDPSKDNVRSFYFYDFIKNPNYCDAYLSKEYKRAVSNNEYRGSLTFQIILESEQGNANLRMREVIKIINILGKYCHPGERVHFGKRDEKIKVNYSEGVFDCWQEDVS